MAENEKDKQPAGAEMNEETVTPGTEENTAAENEQAGCTEQTGETPAEDGEAQESGDAEETAAAENTEKPAEKEEKKGGFFAKKTNKEIAALKERNAALEDQVKRQMAEFDNFRKRTEKEKDQMFSMGEKNVAEKMLPIIDNFERGLGTIEPEDEDDAFTKGMKMVYKQLLDQLTAIGVKPIECIGREFDPNFHNAVMQVETEDYDTGVVAQELQKGYMYRDTVLRHSMVGVAK